jgi:hypothetical protein
MTILVITAAILVLGYVANAQWRAQKRSAKRIPIPLKIEDTGQPPKRNR